MTLGTIYHTGTFEGAPPVAQRGASEEPTAFWVVAGPIPITLRLVN